MEGNIWSSSFSRFRYILSIENARDLEDYLKTLLNFSSAHHRQFYEELLQKRQVGFTGLPLDIQGYKKSETEQIYVHPKQTEKKKKSKGQFEDTSQKENVKEPQGKKKSKFVNLYSSDGQARDVVILKGRHRCDCQASKHRLVSNCLKCGRIVCEQEGSGPCLFCGNLVCSREEELLLASGSKRAEHLLQKLVEQKKPEGLESAIQHRNKLLEYDKTSERRTKVIDDESDYFPVNSIWLSKAEREKLQQQEEELQARHHLSRLDRRLTLDFAGRKVLECDDPEYFYDPEDIVLKEISESIKENRRAVMNGGSVNPGVLRTQPIFQEAVGRSLQPTSLSLQGTTSFHRRVQDRELIEMLDEGCCLTLHQPWASLFVAGIKLHEGRTWYTSHRGRLWIAAALKVPTPQEIQTAEHLYEVLKGGERLQFPLQYPTSCLLGCVYMVDCLPQEEYRVKFPEGESDSPFVFVCEDAQKLPIRFPIQGKHKIYKLDPKIHAAARKSLQRVAELQAEWATVH
ncbi:activating signal cointegrator 1 isoform X2 [Zootermopsis nevadensis]|uniref:activating signal cointegrator 1 isoform X2 n=1 Tax=Zootermopsis nevadensis TaxID=136037 RepID=UPI000B8E4AEC|nr:activating signal cointegrator 1 isoform X2 [Zootermopsis nevadensis]